MSAYKFTPGAVASPDALQKPSVRKRARSGGENWVHVTHRTSLSKAKRPRTAGSQQPACDQMEYQILSASEAAAFAVQFWDKKTHPTKASQHETASALIGELHWCSTGAGHVFIHTDGSCSEYLNWSFCKLFDKLVQCSVHVCVPRSLCSRGAQKCDRLTPPQTYTFLKWPFLTDFKKYAHTPPPPNRTNASDGKLRKS